MNTITNSSLHRRLKNKYGFMGSGAEIEFNKDGDEVDKCEWCKKYFVVKEGVCVECSNDSDSD